jgi:formate hydrogenlyase subunit 3/multisubunit Na+/H+ antiporter MnhD subunit
VALQLSCQAVELDLPDIGTRRKGMRKYSGLAYHALLVLAILSTGFLVFNMVATPTYKQQIFLDQETISAVEIVMLVGFGLVLLFDITSLVWAWMRLRQSEGPNVGGMAIVVLGVLCPFLLLGAKVMVDEISREYRLGWEVLGEWIILYVLLTTQLVYNLVILGRLLRRPTRGRKSRLGWSDGSVRVDPNPGP